MRSNVVRNGSLLLGALAIAGMGTMTVACSPKNEKPAETSVTTPTPTEKAVRTNVTKSPTSFQPQHPTDCHNPNNSINCVITGGPAAGEVTPN